MKIEILTEGETHQKVNDMIDELMIILKKEKPTIGINAMLYILISNFHSKEEIINALDNLWDAYREVEKNENRR